MKPSLQLKLSQQLTLTPQLQQAIRLLQLSNIDLQQEILELLESNPMLEGDPESLPEASGAEEANKESEHEERDWSDFYTDPTTHALQQDWDYNLENIHATTTSLRDHLLWQLELSQLSERDYLIGRVLIDATNEQGFLTDTLTDFQKTLREIDPDIEMDEIEAVRHRIQQFDPLGCASLDLADCLLVQLDHFKESTPELLLTKKIIQADAKALGEKDSSALLKKYQMSKNQLEHILHIIHQLQPRPGEMIHPVMAEYVIPDLYVTKHNGEWQVHLNQQILPKLRINHQYDQFIQRGQHNADTEFLKTHLNEARWFLKSIQNRQETLMKVGKYIINHQQDFLNQGESGMRPLTLSQVANHLDMHESTISRATTQKYIHTPRGIFELKFFFNSHLETDSGESCSSIAIQAMIKTLISSEDSKHPLSDNSIARLIQGKGVHIARRTVAKYREALGISPSFERRGTR